MCILKNLREVVKALEHAKPDIKHCPRCGNSKLLLSSRFDIWLFPETYICEKCGYRGPITIELEKEGKEKNV